MLQQLGRGAARHHWAVIAAWVVALVVLSLGAGRGGGHTKDVFTIPGTAVAAGGVDVLQQQLPGGQRGHRPGRVPGPRRAP